MEGQFSVESETKQLEIESFLSSNAYLSGGPLPGAQDSSVFFSLKAAPDAAKYPNFFHWFATISMFNPAVVKTWGAAKKEQPQKGGKPEKKEETKPAPAADDDDLFGEESEADKAILAAKKVADEEKKRKDAEEKAKKKKEAVIPKSIVIFDVKIIEEDQDLDALAKKILAIEMEGLVWKMEYKKLPVAYNIKKLQIGCIIEDDKVSTDDLFDKIQAWEEEVQSVDVVSFQKN